jgi:hypothetical protein
MPCLVALLALFVPRLVVIGTYLFTNWFVGVFDTLLWPILGFVFTPTFLLWYSVVVNVYDGSWGTWQVVIGAVALVIDLSPSAGAAE